MKITNKRKLSDFKDAHPDAEKQVNAWQAEVQRAEWKTPNELTQQFGSASIMKAGNVVFNICGNKYRLWVKIAYNLGVIFVKAIDTHKEYDKWNIK